MALTARRKRLSALEAQVALHPTFLREESQQRREAAARDALIKLHQAFPESLQEQFLASFEDESVHYDGIRELLNCIGNGVWVPQLLPVEVATIYLQEPQAVPWLRCSICQLLLPKRSGTWRNTETGGCWQGTMRYFANCPSCHGEIVTRGEDKSFAGWLWQPLRPIPPWEFLTESPACVRLQEAAS